MLSLRSKDISLIASLEDGGFVASGYGRYVRDFDGIRRIRQLLYHYSATFAETLPRSGSGPGPPRCRLSDPVSRKPSIYAVPEKTWRSSAISLVNCRGT